LISAETQLSSGRLIMVRLPGTARTSTVPAYLPKGGSVAADLARSGLTIDSPAAVDHGITTFLGGEGGCLDQITPAACREVVELFDRHWLDSRPRPERRDRVLPLVIGDRR
jgi:hypothetical protein